MVFEEEVCCCLAHSKSFLHFFYYGKDLKSTVKYISHQFVHSMHVCVFICVRVCVCVCMGFPDGSVVRNPPANAGDAVSVPGSGRSLEKEMATHSSILAWEISRTEEPGWLQSMGSGKNRTLLSD